MSHSSGDTWARNDRVRLMSVGLRLVILATKPGQGTIVIRLISLGLRFVILATNPGRGTTAASSRSPAQRRNLCGRRYLSDSCFIRLSGVWMDIHRPRCPRLPGTQIFQIKVVTSRLEISASSVETWARNDR